MSYDVTVGGEWFNYTWNLSKFFKQFEVHPYEHMEGRVASEVSESIRRAVEAVAELDMETLRTKYDAPNKWGTVPGAIDWLGRIREACDRHPGEIVHAS